MELEEGDDVGKRTTLKMHCTVVLRVVVMMVMNQNFNYLVHCCNFTLVRVGSSLNAARPTNISLGSKTLFKI